jgi:hypothetical protein
MYSRDYTEWITKKLQNVGAFLKFYSCAAGKKIPSFYETRWLITIPYPQTPSWDPDLIFNQPNPVHTFIHFVRSILILSSHLHLDLQCISSLRVRTEIIRSTPPACFILLDPITLTVWRQQEELRWGVRSWKVRTHGQILHLFIMLSTIAKNARNILLKCKSNPICIVGHLHFQWNNDFPILWWFDITMATGVTIVHPC